MSDYLTQQALKAFWCAPRRDGQAIFRPLRLSGRNGVINQFKVQWQRIGLPTSGVYYHVYHLGAIHPTLVGLKSYQRKWISLASACADNDMIINLYSSVGIQLPLFSAYYYITETGEMVIALRSYNKISFTPGTEALYIRVYSNAFYKNGSSVSYTKQVLTTGKVTTSTQDIVDLQNQMATWAALPGGVIAYVNGYESSNVDVLAVAVGDVVEIVYDSSIKKVVDLPVSGLSTFTSLLDGKSKYLLHYADKTYQLDYQDDVDVYLYMPNSSNASRHIGIYYHKNNPDALRMVTHKDYAIVPDYVSAYTAANSSWTDYTKFTVRLVIRDGGFTQTLGQENNRILDLYAMADADLQAAMLGVNSTVSVWRADNLENSALCSLMRSDTEVIDTSTVETAYGYNAMSKLLADTPQTVDTSTGTPMTVLPYGLQERSTGWEYDKNGVLLTWSSHVSGDTYLTTNVKTTTVEQLAGYFDTLLDETYGASSVTLTEGADYRAYICTIVDGTPDDNWVDVTGSSKYAIKNSVLTWAIDTTKYYTLVRSDRVGLAYTLNLTNTDGLLKFDLNQRMLRNGVTSNYVMQIPLGQLDLFLNGYSLIEGIDYKVNFPTVVIFNKNRLVNPGSSTQAVTVRFSGFCDSDLKMGTADEIGFVKYGVLSRNKVYDLHNDKILRIVVAGQLTEAASLVFDEGTGGLTTPTSTNSGVFADGSPYAIRDILFPLQTYADSDTYTSKATAVGIDKEISDYLTLKVASETETNPISISGKYAIFSPFVCKLIADLKSGVLWSDQLTTFYNNTLVKSLCEPYEYLLTYDPTQESNLPDLDYVIIHPHDLDTMVTLTAYQYKFLQLAVNLYMPGKVSLSSWVAIEASIA